MSSSPSRGAGGAAAAAGCAAPGARRGRRPAADGRCRRRRRGASRCRARLERPGLDPRGRHRPRSSRSPGSTPGATTRITCPTSIRFGLLEVVPAHQVFPVLAGVEADPDQRVAGLDGVEAGLAACWRRRPGGLDRRRPPAAALAAGLAAATVARGVGERSSTGARFGVVRAADDDANARRGEASERAAASRARGASITRMDPRRCFI